MPTVKSRREQYSEETRTALLDAATRRFAERGFTGTSLEEVATDIRATRGAVYHHFANKTALFRAVFERLEADMMVRVSDAAAAHPGDVWQAALAAQGVFLDGCCDPVYGRLVWLEAPIALGWQVWKECEEDYAYGLIERLLQRLMADGDMPTLPLAPLTHVVFHMLGAAGMSLAEAAEEDKRQVRAEYEEVLLTMMNGLRR